MIMLQPDMLGALLLSNRAMVRPEALCLKRRLPLRLLALPNGCSIAIVPPWDTREDNPLHILRVWMVWNYLVYRSSMAAVMVSLPKGMVTERRFMSIIYNERSASQLINP